MSLPTLFGPSYKTFENEFMLRILLNLLENELAVHTSNLKGPVNFVASTKGYIVD